MQAFRTEMRQSRKQEERAAKFVPSAASRAAREHEREVLERANAIFGVGTGEDPSSSLNLIEGPDDDDDGYDYWPDELVPRGIAIDDAEEASSTTSSTSTTEHTETTDSTRGSDDDEPEDTWPIELMVG